MLIEVTCPIPIPPVPITARVKTSLGGVNSAPPSTYRGTILTVAKDAIEVLRKLRRVNLWRLFITAVYYQTNRFPPIQISLFASDPEDPLAQLDGQPKVGISLQAFDDR